jgi:electron transfer flavoprotein beta subunit
MGHNCERSSKVNKNFILRIVLLLVFQIRKRLKIESIDNMKILVCISHVPDTTSKINFTDNDTQFDTNGVQFVINPNDEFGLTRAMWFKESRTRVWM